MTADLVGTEPQTATVIPLRPPAQQGPPEPEPLWRELAGDVLRDERTRQRRTLSDVADRAGISPQYLSEVERGRKEPSSEMLSSICGALGLTLSALLAGGQLQIIRLGSASTFATMTGPRTMPSGPVLMSGALLMAV
ncbi:MAG: helix-turn-helix domain-containing protein [Actinomycetota bacterium]|nr:helix-turn-helix domain-containing protein [Actinomycetota bacterium]